MSLSRSWNPSRDKSLAARCWMWACYVVQKFLSISNKTLRGIPDVTMRQLTKLEEMMWDLVFEASASTLNRRQRPRMDEIRVHIQAASSPDVAV